VPGLPIRAGHTTELSYLFDLGGKPAGFTTAQQRLASDMISYWTTFARTGNPNSTSTPRWAPFSDGATTLRLAPGSGAITPTKFAQDHRCGFWNHHS